MLKTESLLCVVAVVIAFLFPSIGARWFEKIANFFRPIAERKMLSVIAIGILAVVARLAVLSVLPVPAPAIHDEFSYLLMADTFAHGRLANPAPPMWEHFETFHVNMIPTYVSKYYPAQGAFLAIGQVVLRNPFWGVLLSSALMCGAICWMLQGWMPPGWALLGGVLAVIRLGMFSYWADSYWGGAVAGLGGALVLGALPRIKLDPRMADALLFSIGVGLLVNTRPYESVFFLLPIGVVLVVWLIKRRGAELGEAMRSFVAPSAACLVLILVFMGYYFWRTTGSPFRLPYSINEQMYSVNSPFPWIPIHAAPEYRHEVLRRFHEGWHLDQFNEFKNHPGTVTVWRLILLWLFFLGPALSVPFAFALIALPYGMKLRDTSPEGKMHGSVLVSLFVGNCLTVYFMQHYWAPATCVIYALILMSMNYLSSLPESRRIPGRAIVAAAVAVCVVLVPIRTFATRLHIGLTVPVLKSWASASDDFRARLDLADRLANAPGQQLVIVRYSSNHNDMVEWVYNGADIEHEKVIWARDMAAEKNQELIDYFKGRKVWLLRPDENPARIEPYTYRKSSTPVKVVGMQ